jgi:hypothetical protein
MDWNFGIRQNSLFINNLTAVKAKDLEELF